MEDLEGSGGSLFGFKTTDAITFGQDLGDNECLTFSQLKMTWPGTHGPPGARSTLHHHSSDPYGGY
jgi:hypothetical protein